MPVHLYGMLEEELAQRISLHLAIIQELKQAAWLRERQGPRPLQGFFVVRERDGPGSKPRDARWHGGRPRKYNV
jgi:hypothetical protein